MLHTNLFDNFGNPLLLLNEIGRGGEGIVYNIQNNPLLVAKLYNSIVTSEKEEKISTMIKVGNERLLKLTTWPINSLHTSKSKLVGFTMPKLMNYKPIFELYNPKLRLQEFPKADWRFLIYAAINTAKAFAVLHEAGHVIGDVNHGNLFVASDATVQFIDTDSFQIYSENKYWFCEVGVSTHQPPEMQNKTSYKGIIRTPNHDNFGLAIVIFQLLCLARHPFSGRYLGAGDMPIEKAIVEHRYAYSSSSISNMRPPPISLSIHAITSDLRLNFERAFSKEGEQFGFRPSPNDWVTALTELSLKLKHCRVNLSHYFFQELTNCPWCDIEAKSNTTIYPNIGLKSNLDFNINSLWQQFLNIKIPVQHILPDPENIRVLASNSALKIKKKLRKTKIILFFSYLVIIPVYIFFSISTIYFLSIGWIALILLVGFIFFYSEQKKTFKKSINHHLKSTKSDWQSLTFQHGTLSKNYSFETLRNQITELKIKYDGVSKDREKRYKNLFENRFQQQLKEYLDNYKISKAVIEGIGQGRIATLQSYSIETAADVGDLKLMNVSGFGDVLISRLIDWKNSCEKKFIFDSTKGIALNDLARLDTDINEIRRKIEVELSIKISQLSFLSKEISVNWQNLQKQIYEVLPQYAQAIADARTFKI